MNFSIKAMDFYKRILSDTAPATGGFMIFAEYKYLPKNEDYILIFSTNNKEGYNLNEEELTVEQIKNLELNKLDVASLINITKWKKYQENDSDIKTYLSFIKGRKNISKYFLTFIGCADKTTSTESSTRLKNALHKYFKENKISGDEKKAIEIEVYNYCLDCMMDRKEIQLSHISSIVDKEYPEKFSVFASSEDMGVSEIISGDSKALNSLKYIKYKSKNRDFVIEFNNKLLGDEIIYNKEKKTLTISSLPDSLIEQIEN